MNMNDFEGIDNDQNTLTLSAFLTWPRIPLTVLMDAPSNLATSSAELNIPWKKKKKKKKKKRGLVILNT